MVKLTALQMCSVPDVDVNLATIDKLLMQLPQANEHLVVLPECCLYFGGKDSAQLAIAKKYHDNQYLQQQLAVLAKRYQVTLVAGSIPILSKEKTQFTNTCCVFSPSGELLTQYNKIHLFDVDVADSEKNYRESYLTKAGQSLKVAETALAKVGLAICYDLRFPQLFQSLTQAGADIITLPSAFTRVTGKAHWQSLLQARAIENQVYVIAAAQEGIHNNGRETWGHSMIINPWGEIIAELATGEGIISVDYIAEQLTEIRQAMPVMTHNQFETKLKTYE